MPTSIDSNGMIRSTVDVYPARPLQEEWMHDAVCTQLDPDFFFPSPGGDPRPISKVCDTKCDVKEKCLEFAMRMEYGTGVTSRHGMFGGMTPRERHALAKGRGEVFAKNGTDTDE